MLNIAHPINELEDDNELAFDEIEALKAEIAKGYNSEQVRSLLARVTLSTSFQFTGLLDLAGNHLQPSVAANKATGVNAIDVLAKPIWEHPCWRDMPEVQQTLQAAIVRAAHGEFVRFDAPHYIGDKLTVVDFSLSPVIDRAGNVVFITAEGRDVTEQRHLEKEILRQKEALAQLDTLKTQFFMNVSHEFRTPLTLILGPLTEVLAELDAVDPLNQRERLQTTQRNAIRLLKLVNELLDFAALESNKMQACYRPTDLAALTKELASMFESAVEKAGLTLVVNCPPLSEKTYVDRDMWEKIVLNLLSNAFKHTFEGQIEISLQEMNHEIVLCVKDTGVGIPADHLPKLFERFHRIPEAASRTHEGSGIGLALVQELVKLHGGKITAESAVNQGTTFTISLPVGKAHLPKAFIAAETANDSEHLKVQPFINEIWGSLSKQKPVSAIDTTGNEQVWYKTSAGDKVRILLADDNADMRSYIERLLHPYCEVEMVSDGLAAMVAARRQPPDLILSDIMMPEMDGLQLLAQLRNDPALKTIPVILLSARAGEEAQIEGLQMGADDYLVKPFDKRALLARIKANLNLELHRMSYEAQEAKRLLENRFRQLIESNIIGIFSGKVIDGTITQANEYFLNMLGYTRTLFEENGLNWKQLTPSNYQQQADAKVLEFLEQGFLIPFETQYLHCQGQCVDVLIGVTSLEQTKTDFICYVVNISEQKQAEAKVLNYMNRLQQSNKELEHFATIASHDLQEPLRKICLFSDHLKLTEQASLSAEGLDDLDRIHRATDRMRRLIHDLLDLSKIVRKGRHFSRIELNTITNEVIAELSYSYRDIRQRVTISGSCLIDADPDQMHQMMSQLLDNALKFHSVGSLTNVTIQIQPLGADSCQITVADNGLGMKEEYFPRIFDAFVRLQHEKDYPGTGIGLTLVKRIVERHNGRIAVDSALEKGSTFTVILPLHQGNYAD
jgi:PAS domain S-box-containing protein